MAPDTSINLIEKILSNSASDAETEKFNDWLEESKANQKFFQQAKAIWEKLNSLTDKVEFDEAVAKERIISKIQKQHVKARVLKARFWISAAASFLLLIGLGYLFYNSGTFNNDSILYSTSDDEIKEVVLSDGSHVWLNKNSNLQVSKAFNKRQRRVLLQGEAYFEVARNVEKIFKVNAGKTTTKVLGTSFNLKGDDNDNVQLIVNSGKVKFYKKYSLKERKIFGADDMGEYSSSGSQISKLDNNCVNYLSWKTGILTFSNTPLTEVCKALTNHFKVRVESTIEDSGLSLTGTFQDEKIEDILSTIAITLDIKVSSSEEVLIISQNRSK
jgi:ferric-dicitrate binding protein FerR (iron transport regulator)